MEHRPYPKIPSRRDGSIASPSGVWIATEKIHGAQLVVGANGRETRIGKRKAWLDPDEPFFGWQLLRTDLEEAARAFHADLGVAVVRLYGELFGGHYPHASVATVAGVSAIQTGIWYAPDVRFALFDIVIERDERDEGTFVAHDEVESLGRRHGVLTVPILGRGGRADLEQLPVRFPSRVHAALGLPAIDGNFAEGFVLKPNARARAGERFAIKHKLPDFDDARFDESAPWSPNAQLGANDLSLLATRMVNPARIASARSKVGADALAIREEVVLDVLIDLEAAFPTALAALDAEGEESLRAHVATLAAAAIARTR
jgi:Rnl2 family RNA ligase